MQENITPGEQIADLFAADLDSVGADELPTDAAFASLSSTSSASSASCPSSLGSLGTVACWG